METLGIKETMLMRAKLYRKIEEVANGIGALQKEGQNSFSRYKYITHEQVTTALRPLLLKFHLSVMMEIESHNEKEFKSDKGKLTTRSIVDAVFTLVDTETGYFEKFTFPGAEQDNGGKSLQQAITQAQKYFLFKTFKVTDKESDGDSKTTEIQTTKADPKAPAKPKQPAPKLSDLKAQLAAIHTTEGVKAFYNSKGGKDSPKGFKAAVIERAEAIIKESNEEAQSNGVKRWKITSKTGNGQYTITQSIKDGWGCTCKAFQTRKGGQLCKHIDEVIENISSHAK